MSRKWMRRAVYRAGMRVRNARIQKNLQFLMESQKWERARLEDRQLALLRNLLGWAHDRSPHYREKFSRAGCSPRDIRKLSDLAKLPPLEKDELLENRERVQIQGLPDRLFYSETSGSTGTPLVFYRDAEWDAWHNASVMRGYAWHGVDPWERNGYLWGYNLSPRQRLKTRVLDGLQNRFRMFSYDDEEIRKFTRKLRAASYLGGYSSMLYEVAKVINRDGSIEPLTNLKLVRGTSEKIYERYQEEAIKAYGRRIVSEYGAAEAGIIAFECVCGSMHVNMETCLVEVDGDEILVTNLYSKSFPIIRYRLGDYVDYDPQSRCDCGLEHPVIGEVTGRVGQKIRGAKQSYPSLTLYYVFKNLAQQRNLPLNYQAVQEKPGTLRLDLEQQLSSDQRDWLAAEFRKYFDADLEVQFRECVNLRSADRKKRDFVSQLVD